MPSNMKIDSITDALRQLILHGEYGTAGRLPSLRALGQQYGTTHETMNKVIQRLQAEGLLVSQGRAGVFVSRPKLRVPGITTRFDHYLREQGLQPIEKNIDPPAKVTASPEVAKNMHVPVGSEVIRRFRIQGTIDIPYRLAENYYPLSLVSETILAHIREDESFDVIAAIKAEHHQVIKHVHEDVIARLPTPSEQELLKVVRTAPVVEIQRTNFAEDNATVMMFNRIIFVASLFVFSYDYVVSHWVEPNTN